MGGREDIHEERLAFLREKERLVRQATPIGISEAERLGNSLAAHFDIPSFTIRRGGEEDDLVDSFGAYTDIRAHEIVLGPAVDINVVLHEFAHMLILKRGQTNALTRQVYAPHSRLFYTTLVEVLSHHFNGDLSRYPWFSHEYEHIARWAYEDGHHRRKLPPPDVFTEVVAMVGAEHLFLRVGGK